MQGKITTRFNSAIYIYNLLFFPFLFTAYNLSAHRPVRHIETSFTYIIFGKEGDFLLSSTNFIGVFIYLF